MKTPPQALGARKPRIYTLQRFNPAAPAGPPFAATGTGAATPPPAPARPVPAGQPLPRAVIDPDRPRLQLGLDVHLEFIMAVAQKDHAAPLAPRKFTNDELIAYVRERVAEGLQVFCVQESCGFGFTLHRRLVEAGAQSFLITPISLNGPRKTDKLDARVLALRLGQIGRAHV